MRKGYQDAFPEHYHYQDEGCELAPACLNCPFPSCVYEQTGGKQKYLKEWRDRQISTYHSQGKGSTEISRIFRISQRTVQRALRVTKENHEQ